MYILAAACGEDGDRQPEHLHLSRGRPGTGAPQRAAYRRGAPPAGRRALPSEYVIMDVRQLGLPDGAFDLCRT